MKWLFAMALLLYPAAIAKASTHEHMLDNGLKIIVREDHRAPVVVSMVWYKVGSSYEYNGISGISHMLEHMMFQGTEQHLPGVFSHLIADQGGQQNAFTGRDYTGYYQRLEASRLPISFELEADRMANLRLQQERFEPEQEVVKEERRLRVDDQPRALVWEQLNATAFNVGPYQAPVIGWMTDIESYTLADLRKWYDAWYAPNNATLVVVGAVEPEAVFELAAAHFGAIEPREIREPKPRIEPEQRGERRVTLRVPAEVDYLAMGYKVPVLRTVDEPWKAYALEVLTGVLSHGNSSRLNRELVRGRQVAAGASAGYNLYARHDALLTIQGTPARGESVETLEGALREQIERLREELVSTEELERIKAQVVAANVYEQDSIQFQGMQLGTLETVGLDWRLVDEYVARIDAVTAEQVRQVAREFLTSDKLTVAILDPQSRAK
jgi:zinc protease